MYCPFVGSIATDVTAAEWPKNSSRRTCGNGRSSNGSGSLGRSSLGSETFTFFTTCRGNWKRSRSRWYCARRVDSNAGTWRRVAYRCGIKSTFLSAGCCFSHAFFSSGVNRYSDGGLYDSLWASCGGELVTQILVMERSDRVNVHLEVVFYLIWNETG